MDNLPLIIACGLAAIWVSCVFAGLGALYRRLSPLNIIYWGTWVCFALWNESLCKQGAERNAVVTMIVFGALIMGALFYLFGATESDEKARRR